MAEPTDAPSPFEPDLQPLAEPIDDHLLEARLCRAALMLAGVARAIEHGAAENSVRPSRVETLLSKIREVQRLSVGIVASLTGVALGHEADGVGRVVEDLLAQGGTIGHLETRSEIGRARVVTSFPSVGSALAAGTAHTGNIDALARITSKMSDAEVTVLAERDREIAEAATRLGEASFRKRVQHLRDSIRDDHGKESGAQAVLDSYARVALDRDRAGYRLSGSLDPLRGAAVQAALAREYRWLKEHPDVMPSVDDASSADQMMAQALHDLILRGDGADRATASVRPNVTVTVLTDRATLANGPHAATVAETMDGSSLDPAAIGRLCCEATLRRVDLAHDANVQAAHGARSTTPAQTAALRTLYDSCPISGTPWSGCEIHHVIPYRQSRRTVLNELLPISRRWHHLVHEGGWTLSMDDDRTLTLSRPDGTTERTIPFRPAHLPTKQQHELAA